MPYIPSGTELLNPFQILERVGLREGMRCADLGAGAIGHFVFPAARMVGKGGIVYAVDILQSALSGIQSRMRMEGATNVKPIWSDIEVVGAAPITAGSLDLVLVVNNVPNEAIIREAVRILKPGGTLLVVDWKPGATPLGPPSKDRVDRERIKALGGAMRLVCIDTWEAGPYHYAVRFRK